MPEVNIKELREQLAAYITRAEAGEEIVITRHGKTVARLAPPLPAEAQLPDLSEFRAAIQVQGEALSQTVINERRETRY